MNKDRLWKHLALAFGLALLLYVLGFQWIEHRRTRLGPWQIRFLHEPPSAPTLIIQQARLGINNVEIAFPQLVEAPETNVVVEFVAARPVPFSVPFGRCAHQDATFLPGALGLEIGPHLIQVFPRALTVDGREISWQTGLRLEVPAPPTDRANLVE